MLPMLLALAGGSAIAGTATDEIRLGQPNYGGTGCPAGTASTTLSPDAQSLSILFDAYQAEAGGVIGRNTDRKACNIAIPVTVPQGYSVSIIQIDYRGFNTLPSGAQSRFSVEYFFAGSQGPAFAQNFFGPITQDFLINNTLRAEAVVWSACGADVNLRANRLPKLRLVAVMAAVAGIPLPLQFQPIHPLRHLCHLQHRSHLHRFRSPVTVIARLSQ